MSGFEYSLQFPLITARSHSELSWSTTITDASNPVPTNVDNQSTYLEEMPSPVIASGSPGSVIAVQSNTHGSTRGNSPEGGQAPSDGGSPGYDWFEKIIRTPTVIDFGPFIQAQETINTYSTYRRDTQQLTAIDLTTGAGTSIVDLPSLPLDLPPQTGLGLVFQALQDGPAVLSGDIDYVFSNDQLSISIPVTGLRTIILPWPAESGIVEKLSWRTDIIKAYSRETRKGLRSAPRRSFQLQIALQDQEKSEFEELVRNQTNAFTAVCWWDQYVVGGIDSDTTTIDVDTTASEFQVGGLALVMQQGGLFELRGVKTINAGSIVLATPLDNAYEQATIIPAFASYIQTVGIEDLNNGVYTANLNLILIDHYTLPTESYTQHRSIDVIPDRNIRQNKVNLRIIQNRRFADNSIGVVKPFATEDRSRQLTTQTWVKNSYTERYALKQWLYSRFGQRVSFFYPSWNNDIQLLEDFVSGSSNIDVETTSYLPNFDIQIELVDGSLSHHQVIEKTALEDGGDRLTLSDSIDFDAEVDEVKAISIMREMRHAADNVSLKYENYNKTTASVGITEL